MTFFDGKRFEDIADESTKKVFRVIGTVFFSIWIVGMFAVMLIARFTDTGKPYAQSVEIENLRRCAISYSENRKPKTVTICGNAISEQPDHLIYLTLRVYQINRIGDDETRILLYDKLEDPFPEGAFQRTINVRGVKGNYLLEFVRARRVISSLEFKIP